MYFCGGIYRQEQFFCNVCQVGPHEVREVYEIVDLWPTIVCSLSKFPIVLHCEEQSLHCIVRSGSTVGSRIDCFLHGS